MLNRLLLGGIVLILALCIGFYFYAEWQKARFDASLPEPPPATELPDEAAPREKPPRGTDTLQVGYNRGYPPRAQAPLPLTAEEDKLLNEFYEYAERVQMSDDAYYEGLLNLLTKGMSPEEAVRYLEARAFYSPALLKRIDDVRALQYVLTIFTGADTEDTMAIARPIAERVLAADPGNLEAGFYLAKTKLGAAATHRAAAAEVYRSLLPYHPDSPVVLEKLGAVLWEDKPVEAIRYLKQANRLDPAYGDFQLGFAYQRVGDYDTALFHLRRFRELPSVHPIIRGRAGVQIANIESGDPSILPIALESGTAAPEAARGAQDDASVQPQHPPSAAAPRVDFDDRDGGIPEHLDDSRDAAAEAARAEYQKLRAQARQELQRFLQGYTADDRIADELKTLTDRYDPGRLSRAIETLSQHGPGEGMRRLKARDPELAEQFERRMNRER